MRHARAKVLGGCSVAQLLHRLLGARPRTSTTGPATGCTGWSADDLFPLYQRLETNDAPGDHHGRTGPVTLRTVPPRRPVRRRAAGRLRAGGHPDHAVQHRQHGGPRRQLVPDQRREDGTRSSASVVLSPPDHGQAAESRGTHRAAGQAAGVRRRAALHRRRVPGPRPRSTPAPVARAPRGHRLLRRHRLAQAADALRHRARPRICASIGIEVLVDSPGVGAHLQDHPEGVIMWEAKQPMVTAVHPVVGDRHLRRHRAGPGPARPDVPLRLGAVRHEHLPARLPHLGERASASPRTSPAPGPAARCGCAPATSGTSRRSTRATSPHEHDMRVMTYGLRLAREIAAQPADGRLGRRASWLPGLDVAVRRRAARLHPQDPQHRLPPGRHGADGRGRRRGRRRSTRSCGSRASPGCGWPTRSVMPDLPHGQSRASPTMMIGEKCADMIKGI